MVRSSSSRDLASAFDSAFLSRRRMYLHDFSGQRPKIPQYEQTRRSGTGKFGLRTLCGLELLGLRSASNATIETTERNDLLVLLDIGEVGVGLGQFKTYKFLSFGMPRNYPKMTHQ